MPLYNEVWDEEEFTLRNHINLQTLPKNHVKLLGNLKFEFIEYKANQLLACHLYDKMAQHCKNQYGLFEDSFVPDCVDARNFFMMCVRLNSAYGTAKKYFPEYFVSSPYSRPNPNFQDLAI